MLLKSGVQYNTTSVSIISSSYPLNSSLKFTFDMALLLG